MLLISSTIRFGAHDTNPQHPAERHTAVQVKAVTKVVFYKKLNPNHRKYAEGSTATSKRRSLLQTPIPPQNGVLYNGADFLPYTLNSDPISACGSCLSLRRSRIAAARW